MIKYLKEHENRVNDLLHNNGKVDWEELLDDHRTVTGYLQHERLIHLLVTLSFGIVFVALVIISLIYQWQIFLFSDVLVLILLVPYVFHYYQLENGVQRFYRLDKKIKLKIRQ